MLSGSNASALTITAAAALANATTDKAAAAAASSGSLNYNGNSSTVPPSPSLSSRSSIITIPTTPSAPFISATATTTTTTATTTASTIPSTTNTVTDTLTGSFSTPKNLYGDSSLDILSTSGSSFATTNGGSGVSSVDSGGVDPSSTQARAIFQEILQTHTMCDKLIRDIKSKPHRRDYVYYVSTEPPLIIEEINHVPVATLLRDWRCRATFSPWPQLIPNSAVNEAVLQCSTFAQLETLNDTMFHIIQTINNWDITGSKGVVKAFSIISANYQSLYAHLQKVYEALYDSDTVLDTVHANLATAIAQVKLMASSSRVSLVNVSKVALYTHHRTFLTLSHKKSSKEVYLKLNKVRTQWNLIWLGERQVALHHPEANCFVGWGSGKAVELCGCMKVNTKFVIDNVGPYATFMTRDNLFLRAGENGKVDLQSFVGDYEKFYLLAWF